jgi:catechol 2,3-dioxygenase-like lactoylglutathione lyase family enzyme
MAKERSTTTRTARPTGPRQKKASSRTAAAPLQTERRARDPETLRLRSFEPSLTVNNLDASLRFYSDVLGFIVGERWNDDSGVLRGVMLKAGVCELGLSQDDWAKGRDRAKGGGVRIWCKTGQDINQLAARIKTAGGRLTEEPKDQPWGVRSLSVDDPDGYHFTIYQET